MIYYVYAYLRKSDNSPYYIGKGKGNRAWSKDHPGIGVPNDHLKIVLLESNLSEESAFEVEKKYIQLYGRKDIGTGILYNKTNGGEGVSGHIHSAETRQLLSNQRKGVPKSTEHNRKNSEAHKGKIGLSGRKNGMYGKTHSKEARMKIIEANLGKKMSNEAKQKMSLVRKGRKWFNNGMNEAPYFIKDAPVGYVLGRLKRSNH